MSDLTKIASKLLIGVKELCDWGINEGHIDPEQMKLTVTGLRVAGSKMIESGLTKTAAAAALGVPRSTFTEALDPDVQEKRKARRRRSTEKASTVDGVPSEEEAEESYQQTLFEQACLLLSEMSDETRQRFFAKLKEGYRYAA